MNTKIRKTFEIEGVKMMIVDRDEPYMGGNTVRMTRVVNEHGLLLPIKYTRNQTLKAMIQASIEFVEFAKQSGFNIVAELSKSPMDKFYDIAASRNLPRSVNMNKAV